MAATSWKRDANCTEARARVTRTTPSSSGWRSPSRTAGWNSPSSSKKSTPPFAKDTSPGRMLAVPPPTIATSDAVWCGARSGGRRTSPPAEGQAGGRVDHGGLQRQVPAEGGEEAGQALSQHRLARARWPEQEEVVTTCGGGLDGEAGHDLAPHVSQIRQRDVGRDLRRRRGRRPGRDRGRAPRPARTGSGPNGPPAARRAPPWLHTPAARPAWDASSRGDERHDPRYPAHRTVEPELAEEGQPRARRRPAPPPRPPARRRRWRGRARHRSCAHRMARRLTVMRVIGQGSPLDSGGGGRGRCASRQASSGRPTTLNVGRPLATWTLTETGRPSAPSNVADGTMASISASLTVGRHAPSHDVEGGLGGGAGKPEGTVAGGCDTVRRTGSVASSRAARPDRDLTITEPKCPIRDRERRSERGTWSATTSRGGRRAHPRPALVEVPGRD